MPLIAIEAIIKIVMYILGWIVTKKINDKELRAAFVQFAELARSENIKTIVQRQRAEEQLKLGSEKWDEIEKAEVEAKKGKK